MYQLKEDSVEMHQLKVYLEATHQLKVDLEETHQLKVDLVATLNRKEEIQDQVAEVEALKTTPAKKEITALFLESQKSITQSSQRYLRLLSIVTTKSSQDTTLM